LEGHLHTSYEPECEWIDGVLQELFADLDKLEAL
jgi:hypothetical protein